MLCSFVLFQHTWHSYKSIMAIIVYEHRVSSTAHWSLWEGFALTSLGTESVSLRAFDQPVTATKFPTEVPLCGRGDSSPWAGCGWLAGTAGAGARVSPVLHCRLSWFLLPGTIRVALCFWAWQVLWEFWNSWNVSRKATQRNGSHWDSYWSLITESENH